MNVQKETFWIVTRWWQNASEVEELVDSSNRHQKFWSLDSAEEALDKEFMDGLDKGETGQIFKVKATFTWEEV